MVWGRNWLGASKETRHWTHMHEPCDDIGSEWGLGIEYTVWGRECLIYTKAWWRCQGRLQRHELGCCAACACRLAVPAGRWQLWATRRHVAPTRCLHAC